jgi:hypothetical protein
MPNEEPLFVNGQNSVFPSSAHFLSYITLGPRLINYYTPTNALLCIVFSLKFTLKHLKCSYMFRSSDHQGEYTVPC